jgi:hypothetical protein
MGRVFMAIGASRVAAGSSEAEIERWPREKRISRKQMDADERERGTPIDPIDRNRG